MDWFYGSQRVDDISDIGYLGGLVFNVTDPLAPRSRVLASEG